MFKVYFLGRYDFVFTGFNSYVTSVPTRLSHFACVHNLPLKIPTEVNTTAIRYMQSRRGSRYKIEILKQPVFNFAEITTNPSQNDLWELEQKCQTMMKIPTLPKTLNTVVIGDKVLVTSSTIGHIVTQTIVINA